MAQLASDDGRACQSPADEAQHFNANGPIETRIEGAEPRFENPAVAGPCMRDSTKNPTICTIRGDATTGKVEQSASNGTCRTDDLIAGVVYGLAVEWLQT